MASSCIPGRHQTDFHPIRSSARDSLLQADQHRVDTLAVRGYRATMTALLAPDAIYLRPGSLTAFGREDVVAMLALNTATPAEAGWQPVGGELSRDALDGYTYGVAVEVPGSGRAAEIARYIAVWSRTRGGPWKIRAYAEVGRSIPVSSGVARTLGVPTRIPPQSRRTTRDIMQADSDFAEASTRQGSAPAFAEAMADYGILLTGPEIIAGPAAVRDFFEAQRGSSLIWHPTYAAVAGSDDLGFTVGESIATSRGPTGAAVQQFGKYLTVWRKQPDGKWKFVVHGSSRRPSPVGE